MSTPLVTVIMPIYNAQATLKRAIASVQTQSLTDLEICAVDDASFDKSWDALNALAEGEPRLRIFQHKNNLGAAAARNTALEEARGRYIAFLDADDEWLPEKLERQINFMKMEKAAFSCTAYYRIHEKGHKRITSVPKFANRIALLKNNTVGTLTVIYDSEILGKQSFPRIRSKEDFVIWLQFLNICNIVFGLNEPLAIYHKSKNSLSANKLLASKEQWQVLRTQQRLKLAPAIWYFINYAFNSIKRNL